MQQLTRRARLAAAVLLLLVGCGTRLPAKDFAAPTGPPASGGDTASDTGVTAGQIKVGIITSLTSPLGTEVLSGPRYGALAFFQALNAAGGLHGRTVQVVTCDDGGSGIGNQDCVHQLIDHDQVFALTAGSSLDYAGASYVSGKAVPDVGGQPIGTEYDRWPHLFEIYGNSAPRDGRSVGWDGTLYQTTEVYRFFKQRLNADRAAVVAYNQAESLSYAHQIEQGLAAEGYHVLTQTVDLALPAFQAVATALSADHTQLLFDAMDTRGNTALCQALDTAGVKLAAKVTNVQNWTQTVARDYQSAPGCRAVLWATSSSRNYADTQYPAVQDFRTAMQRYYPDRQPVMSAWELEGWAAAQWLTDAMASCGAALTRACAERFMNRAQPYDAHGLLIPTDFVRRPRPSGPTRACLDVARWQDGTPAGGPGWVTQVPDMDTNCFEVPQLPYQP
ncbi:ABC-type branched-subunit amino acid transport system substrate-binding protein [Kitasatospora sp. GP30]|uniref:ABC transporter substrate-binding protein n=1 Tax=Kitasatospora sp. GP30 TaxID=3035084 RepID=UPI000C7147ED|nr:ABC transporter substrate-binding protein [Kitasatospora sp. GP30]MDH6142845.1 ABC-type branched-subunit amino acid transport system substrate-binding protein [Kitasatospora sp. GP30]